MTAVSPAPRSEKQWDGGRGDVGGTASIGRLGTGRQEGWVCFPRDRSQVCSREEGGRKGGGRREEGGRKATGREASTLAGVHGGGDSGRERDSVGGESR